ncbi:uncharacterized protein E6C27_scaffold84G00600 [Cucumis melo var. makuwa]|uniref:Gag-pro-like protein n=1 Tax=Cucumis melo var. makuwa TaxID=1194695 RepID=A0A5A7TCG9_CUCMM|nr:uncharacterized protein E6C27_scaffold84G00600 [Cucumis melo var. makuwa]
MDEQTNDQVQAVRQDVEGLKDQLAKILELLITGRGKSVTRISSEVEVDLNLVLEDMPAYPPGFTLQRSSSPRMTYPTQNPNPITQQENHVSDPMSTPITKSDVVIPPKFKTPDFEKYNGTTCPKSHLVMYCRKMSAYAHDDKLLIHCFQDSLVGPASRWYMQLDGSQVHRMEKKNVETFKEYAQRWRELAAQVQPPLTDKELMAMFINTLRAPYYDRMVGSASTNFSDVITIGERIEFGVKNGRISDPASEIRRMMSPKKKEEEIHELSSTQRVVHVSSPTVGQTNYSYSYQNEELLPQLLKSLQVAIVPQELLKPPYPKWYDPNVKCEYHAGVVGHSTENCFPLKAKVQSLVKAGWLKFKKTEEESDVNQNPLPNHEGPAINIVDTFTERYKNKVCDVTTSMNTLFQILRRAGYLSPRFNNDEGEKFGCANEK